MASGKLSPRQKMINLMYLVFIAMLALNMSKEVLTAFGLMKEKFEYSNAEMTLVNQQFFDGLQIKAAENPDKFGPLLEQANQIKIASQVYFDYLEGLKTSMTAKYEDKQDYERMDRTDYLDQLFFNGDNYSKEGKEFIAQLNAFKTNLNGAIPSNLTNVIKALDRRFSVGDAQGMVQDREGKNIPWLNYHYEGYPMVSSLASFTQLQSDIKITEQEAFKGMLEGQLTSELSMTNYTTLLEQEKSAFYQGEAFSGSIVLVRS